MSGIIIILVNKLYWRGPSVATKWCSTGVSNSNSSYTISYLFNIKNTLNHVKNTVKNSCLVQCDCLGLNLAYLSHCNITTCRSIVIHCLGPSGPLVDREHVGVS